MDAGGPNRGRLPTIHRPNLDQQGSDVKPFEFIAGSPKAGILLICDHASNRIPREFGTLELDAHAAELHVAWDIGAAALTRRLAARFAFPAVLTTASRLVIDCNRTPGHAASIPAVSHGVVVPGNQDLSGAQRLAREDEFFHPYHRAIAAELGMMETHGGAPAPALVSIHSFTPVLADMTRPWHVGILSDHDRRLADFFLAVLRQESGIVVGDNEPYSGRHPEGYSCPTHGDARGRPNVLIEVRQDLLVDDININAWVERLGGVLEELLRLGPAALRPDTAAAMAQPGRAA